jgi:hypothetical protein
MLAAQECVLSCTPWTVEYIEGVEILFDDHSQSPFALHLVLGSFDLLPAEPELGREWKLSVWTSRDGAPHKEMEMTCHWRRVPRIPWLRPWL